MVFSVLSILLLWFQWNSPNQQTRGQTRVRHLTRGLVPIAPWSDAERRHLDEVLYSSSFLHPLYWGVTHPVPEFHFAVPTLQNSKRCCFVWGSRPFYLYERWHVAAKDGLGRCVPLPMISHSSKGEKCRIASKSRKKTNFPPDWPAQPAQWDLKKLINRNNLIIFWLFIITQKNRSIPSNHRPQWPTMTQQSYTTSYTHVSLPSCPLSPTYTTSVCWHNTRHVTL
jgi:hypothetical protein